MIPSGSHKKRSFYLGNPGVACAVCGAAVGRGAVKYCSLACSGTARLSVTEESRFWAKVNRDGPIHPALGTACWLWTGSCQTFGYGQFTLSGATNKHQTNVRTHVYSYKLAHGPLPPGVWVLHRCDNPACVRPDHLFTGNHAVNMADAAAKGRLHTARPSRHKLTPEQIEDVRERVANGELQYRLAEEFGVTKGHISQLISGSRRQYDAPLRPRLRRSA